MARLLTLATALPGKLRSRRTIRRVLVLASWVFLLHELVRLLLPHHLPFAATNTDFLPPPHPIRSRLDTARRRWEDRLQAQSTDYISFKRSYRARYALEPPEGMREWFRIVSDDGVLLVDEFDELMKSLEPFRTMDPQELIRRTLEVSQMPTFSLLKITHQHAHFYGTNYRGDGAHYSREKYGPGIERVEGLASMLQRHISLIPEGTIFAVSELAEPRVIVPWQDHPTTLLSFDKALNHQPSSHSKRQTVLKEYHHRLPSPNLTALLPTPNFVGSGSAWELYAKSCPPESSARKSLLSLKGESSVNQRMSGSGSSKDQPKLKNDEILIGKGGKSKTYQTKRRASLEAYEESKQKKLSLNETIIGGISGVENDDDDLASVILNQIENNHEAIVSNFNSAEELIKTSKQFNFVEIGYRGLKHDDLCSNSELHQIQGAFYSDWRGLQALYPVFSPSKIDGYSDILIPSNFYYGDDARYSFEANETIEWDEKKDKLFWRGKTTGGGNSPPRHQLQYQRHRFVRLAQSLSRSFKSLLVPRDGSEFIYHVKRAVGDLNKAWLDVGFTGYTGCGDPDICDLTAALYPLKASVPLRDMARYKAILDLDGMAFSGRFVALMSMGSGVIKSTIFKDALTDWIEPWVHYVPLSVGYEEMYNLLGYFLPLPTDDIDENEDSSKTTRFFRLKRTTRSIARKLKKWYKRWIRRGTVADGGDEELRRVAEDGLKWSESVGNKADIEAYVLRLALEWARLLGKIGDEEIEEGEEIVVSHD